jgi:hypothetical protein
MAATWCDLKRDFAEAIRQLKEKLAGLNSGNYSVTFTDRSQYPLTGRLRVAKSQDR